MERRFRFYLVAELGSRELIHRFEARLERWSTVDYDFGHRPRVMSSGSFEVWCGQVGSRTTLPSQFRNVVRMIIFGVEKCEARHQGFEMVSQP